MELKTYWQVAVYTDEHTFAYWTGGRMYDLHAAKKALEEVAEQYRADKLHDYGGYILRLERYEVHNEPDTITV